MKTIILLFHPRAGFNNSKLGARVWLVAKFWFSLPKDWAQRDLTLNEANHLHDQSEVKDGLVCDNYDNYTVLRV